VRVGEKSTSDGPMEGGEKKLKKGGKMRRIWGGGKRTDPIKALSVGQEEGWGESKQRKRIEQRAKVACPWGRPRQRGKKEKTLKGNVEG